MDAAIIWEAEVAEYLFEGPRNEDGERRVESSYFVTLVNEKGVRYASTRAFLTTDAEPPMPRVRKFLRAVELALKAGATPENNLKWNLYRPVYGSAAYTEMDQESVDRQTEIEEDRWG